MTAPPFPSERKLGWASRTGLLTRAILLAGTFPELKLQWLSEFAQAKSLFRFEPERGRLQLRGSGGFTPRFPSILMIAVVT